MIAVFGSLTYKVKTDRFFMQSSINTMTSGGNSMLPTMPNDKVPVKMYAMKPIENDIISFKCSKAECLKWGDTEYSGGFTKRLIEIREDGAIWVDGDNKDNSFDSDYFGWLLPSEVSDVWVIKLN